MSKTSNKRKADQLGMPIGTAQNRLRKMVMFDLLVRLGEATCFQCGEQIESAEDLSLEHKVPWLGESNELYWDVENVAFSHPTCNSRARRDGYVKGVHGKLWTYHLGCRCDECRAEKSRYSAEWKSVRVV